MKIIEIDLNDTFYSTSSEKEEFIYLSIQDIVTECFEEIKYAEENMIKSLVNFCITGKFLDEW